MATRRKAAKKKAAAKSARKRAAKRPARRTAPRRAAKPVKKRAAAKAAKKRAAKRPAAKAAKKRTAKRSAPKRAPKRPAAKAAKKRAAKPRAPKRLAPSAFAPQKAGASAKDLLLFELERARVAVMASIQGLGAGAAMRPMREGGWSIHETVLHLGVRDRVRLDEFDAMLDGTPASWAGVTDPAEEAAVNEAHLAPLRALSWDEAVRRLTTTRAALLERLQAVPAEPAAVWAPGHPFGDMMHRLVRHDRGHAEAIKNARIAG